MDLQQALWQKKPGHMSGGESQRVRIAAELIAGPQLLFLDEPAKGLDHGREVALMKLLRSLSYQGCTVIVITHSLGHLGLLRSSAPSQEDQSGEAGSASTARPKSFSR